MTKEATREELDEVWQNTEDYWNKMSDKMDMPWVKARFMLSIFKSGLSMKGLRVPMMMGGPFR